MTAEPRRLRILMVLESEFPVARGGGSEIQLRTLGEALRRRGHRVTVLTPRLALGPQATAGRHFGLAVGRLAYPRIRVLGGLIMLARMALFLRGHGRRYDAVHVHIAHHLALVCCAVAPTVGLRSVVKVSGWWELGRGLMRPDGSLLARLVRPLWRRVDAWQAVSTRISAALEGLGVAPDRVHSIPNAIDLARFPARSAERAAGAPRTLVFVGRLAPEKDLRNLVRAWSQACGGRRDRRLWLVGTGREMKPLQRLVEKLGCAGNVEFLGHRDDVSTVLAQADVGVLPSLMEGLSNTLLEFMASALPVLASRVSGSEDLVKPGRTGWLHEAGDVQGMVGALRAMDVADDAQLAAMGRNARIDVECHASCDRVIDQLLAAYSPDMLPGLKRMEAC
ncbi:MAG: glycosyltransferase family 4 protein [Luteimonas sp.]|nr:glycosyltransferase family 4 protein [Luteimonas sp.]